MISASFCFGIGADGVAGVGEFYVSEEKVQIYMGNDQVTFLPNILPNISEQILIK